MTIQREVLLSLLIHIHHWRCGVEFGVMPTRESLEAAQAELVKAITTTEVS